MSCSTTIPCSELVPSKCVMFTGSVSTDGIIYNSELCDPDLNDIIKVLDDSLSQLVRTVGVNKTSFDNANISCGITPVVITEGVEVIDNNYNSSEIILSLIPVICTLRSRLNMLISGDINTSSTVHWEDLKLSDAFKQYVYSNAPCLNDACGVTSMNTLSDLLKMIIVKLCACCP